MPAGARACGAHPTFTTCGGQRLGIRSPIVLAIGLGGAILADAGKSTLQSILENLRDAVVGFGERFANPANIQSELTKLLADLGIDDPLPGRAVSNSMRDAATAWATIANQLKGMNFNFLDPVAAVNGLVTIGQTIQQQLEAMGRVPASTTAALGASAADIARVLPERLLHYIVFEFVTKSHKKIGGAFLLLGILRREFKPKGASLALIDANVRVFDVAQMVKVITHPREAILEALKWGTDEFDSQTVVDGVSLLFGLLADVGVVLGPEVDAFPAALEATFVGRSTAELSGLRPLSARRTLTAPSPLGNVTISLVGLHRDGLGLMLSNPVNLSGGVGSLNIPKPPPGVIFAVSAGAPPPTADPRVRFLP